MTTDSDTVRRRFRFPLHIHISTLFFLLALKPAKMNFEEAAAVPLAAGTALRALVDYGNVKAGMKVLINGAAGGVGTFAVQIARALGAEVTAVLPFLLPLPQIGRAHV